MKKKKIGIITFHASYNCGSMLQAYALQKIIQRRYGALCEIINFSNPEQQRMYSVLFKPRTVKEVLRNILNFLFYFKIKRSYRDYKKFSDTNLQLSGKKINSLKELEEAALQYDVYITGSDQVWNINAQDFDDAYFLPFVKSGTKVAYAVSLGAADPNRSADKNKYAEYLNKFDGISVRERNAEKWLRKLTDKDIKICLDPTLLFPVNEWDEITGEREAEGKYIFWYTMIYKKEICKIVTEAGKKYGMPVYVIDAKEWSRRALYLHGIKLARNGGPASFLSLVKNAEIVFTSSFHGAIFCNVFKKNFWYINIHSRDTGDDRASYLLSQLGMSERYVSVKELQEKNLLLQPSYPDKSVFRLASEMSLAFLDRFCI